MNLSIIGAGAVGSAVAELASSYGHTVTALADSRSAVVDTAGVDVQSVIERKRDTGIVGDDPSAAALHAQYECLVEVTPVTLGDAEPGVRHVFTALEQDCHVVLGNKGPVAQRYRDVRERAAASEGEVSFESVVSGPLPILSTINDVGRERIHGVRGVFNGLANFLLSRMAAEGIGYEHVLAEAQDLGFAEVDPSYDVEGTDTALTCSILANVLSPKDQEFTIEDVSIEGITEIPGSALDLAKEDGRTVRLLGEVRDEQLRVAPRTLPDNSSLAVTGTQTVVELDIQDAGQVSVTRTAPTSTELATALLAEVNRLEDP